MSEKKTVPFDEWVKERLNYTGTNRDRAQAFHDTRNPVDLFDGSIWNWFAGIFRELNTIYSTLNDIDSWRAEDKKEISERVAENEKKLAKLQKSKKNKDKEITDVLIKLQKWMVEYQPALDKLKEEYDLLGKAEKK